MILVSPETKLAYTVAHGVLLCTSVEEFPGRNHYSTWDEWQSFAWLDAGEWCGIDIELLQTINRTFKTNFAPESFG